MEVVCRACAQQARARVALGGGVYRRDSLTPGARGVFGRAHAGAPRQMEAVPQHLHTLHHGGGSGGVLPRALFVPHFWPAAFALVPSRATFCNRAAAYTWPCVFGARAGIVYAYPRQGVYLCERIFR